MEPTWATEHLPLAGWVLLILFIMATVTNTDTSQVTGAALVGGWF